MSKKYDLLSDTDMKDFWNDLESDLVKEIAKADVPCDCPKCHRKITVHVGKNECPYCHIIIRVEPDKK